MGWFGNGEVFECLDIVAPYAGLYGLNGSVLGLFDKISLLSSMSFQLLLSI